MSCLYILEIKPLVASFANIFSNSVGCLFVLFMVSFAVQKLVSLIRFHFKLWTNFKTFSYWSLKKKCVGPIQIKWQNSIKGNRNLEGEMEFLMGKINVVKLPVLPVFVYKINAVNAREIWGNIWQYYFKVYLEEWVRITMKISVGKTERRLMVKFDFQILQHNKKL